MDKPADKAPKGMAMILEMEDDEMESSEESEQEGSKQYITPPEGYSPPAGVAEGASFDITAKAKMEGGRLCIESIDGIPLQGAKPKAPEPEGEEEDALMAAAKESRVWK